MAKVTVTLPHFNPQMPAPDPVVHEGANEFAAVNHDAGHVLEVYSEKGDQVAAYAPGCWASAVLS